MSQRIQPASDKLDIGCGRNKRPGFIGLDASAASDADVVADIDEGLPFPDNSFREVWMSHVFEHVSDTVHLMEEIWRVCQDGARIEIRGPHFSRPDLVWGDPTHKRALSLGTFLYFTGEWYITESRFRFEKCVLAKSNSTLEEVARKPWRWPLVPVNRAISSIVNLSPRWIGRYERAASRFYGFDEIQVVLRADKSKDPAQRGAQK